MKIAFCLFAISKNPSLSDFFDKSHFFMVSFEMMLSALVMLDS